MLPEGPGSSAATSFARSTSGGTRISWWFDNLDQSEKHRNLNALFIADFIDKRAFLEQLPRLSDVATIFHQGACSSTTETDGRYMMENNYAFSKTLLHHCLDRKINFLYASSASVYGNGEGEAGMSAFSEQRANENPLNVYAFSKFMFDNYVRRLQETTKPTSQVLGLRYFNAYGYQENHKGSMASVVYHFYRQLQEGNAMKLFAGSEDFRRDFIFIKDVVDVNMHFYANGQSGIYNCGTGQARSFTDIARVIQRLEPDAKIETIPFPDHLRGKYQTYTQADSHNLRESGYRTPFTSLEEGVTKYYRMLKEQGGWFPVTRSDR